MDQPPQSHGFLTDLAISIIGGLITLIVAIVGWFTKEHVKELKDMREKIQKIEVHHTSCVTRDELDRKFEVMREDGKERERRQDARHNENLDTLKEVRDGYREVHKRIDELLTKRSAS